MILPPFRSKYSEKSAPFRQSDALKISRSSEFSEIRKAPTFVDKTLLIKDLFEGVRYAEDPLVLVTAPRRFGKSVNMSMIEHFLEKQVDWNSGTELQSNPQDSNTELFANLKIMKHKEFVKKHFGKYVILKISYLCPEPITDEKKALDFYKAVIHEAYKKHHYLRNSSKLEEYDRNVCKEWYAKEHYFKKDDELVPGALKNLSEYLHLHYEGKLKVFVLLDEYDSPFYNAMARIKDKDLLQTVIDKGISMITRLVKENCFVQGAFLTGISHIAGLGLSTSLGSVSLHRFLKKDNDFTAYYGFSQSEVDCLFEKCNVPDSLREKAKLHYNGYQSEDGKHSMYNPWSITRFINKLKTNNFWITSGAVQGLLPALRSKKVKTEIGIALLLSNENSHVTCLDSLDETDFYRLHTLISDSMGTNNIPTPEVFLTFLLEQGYLAFCGNEGFLKVPNEEVRSGLHKKLKEHFMQIYGIQALDMNDCRSSFSKLFSAQTADMTDFITDLKNQIEKFFTPLKTCETINHHILQQILFFPLFETKYKYLTEIQTEEKKRPDFFLYKEDHGVIIELKYMPNDGKHNDSKQALRQILEARYYMLFGDAKYFNNFPKTFVLIGLSFNSELQVSVHCLSSSKISVEYRQLTTKDGLKETLKKGDIDKLLTIANVVSFNPV